MRISQTCIGWVGNFVHVRARRHPRMKKAPLIAGP